MRRSTLAIALVAFRSACAAASTGITAARSKPAANINAVCPRDLSRALTSAPASSRAFTASTLPEAAANISGRGPQIVGQIRLCARLQERLNHRGVALLSRQCQRRERLYPRGGLQSAPAEINSRASAASSFIAAQ